MDDLNDWLGRKREAHDLVTERLAREYRVTTEAIRGGHDLMPGLHWCLAPEIYPARDLGRDGHPKLGLFLPAPGLPRRMWAGGRIAYHGALAVGCDVTRRTEITDISFKQGRSGRLAFVALTHRYEVAGKTRIEERHDIVYRGDPGPGAPPPPAPPKAAPWPGAEAVQVTPDATLLLRYSAASFNGHRIHYDLPYATGVEGYGGLVVHGPLQATWMQVLATHLLGRLPTEFTYRGLTPLICDRPAAVEARADAEGLELRVRDLGADAVTMQARAR
ncbi:hypothetical protein U879_15530 [Defluviimonas sp. 20V17]|nr:MaoC family dehydratase N-terminal domain-containing protein [Allgaiera indica]KDB02796.1 hypothetical protein U879_15530 [Defluviimonas sp. 20V17]